MIEHGSRSRVLSLIDEYTRRCLVLRAGWSLRAKDVIDILEESIATYGSPKHIRSDNGPEFIAYAIQDWLGKQRIGPLYIKPGSPWQQAYIESFHDKLRSARIGSYSGVYRKLESFSKSGETSTTKHGRTAR